MSIYRIQGSVEKAAGIYYEFDSDQLLGEGGMGKVYKGRCVRADGSSRNVAVKFMYSDLTPYAIEKARREAAMRFRHDNLVEMLGFIETEGKPILGETEKHYHVVSELLEGTSLDKFFNGRLTDQQGNLVPFAEKLHGEYTRDVERFSIFIVKNILSGLTTMHDAGYIHRDIDPSNIMITSDGHIKLIDFGIAKKMKSLTQGDRHLTQAGQFVGKPEYAAPELVLGAIDEQNQTTDIYAVGILLFQCLTGHVPFQGDRGEVMQKQIHASLPLKQIKNKDLRKIIERATEKARSKRFQSASEFRVALDNVNLNPKPNILRNPVFWYTLGGVGVCAALTVAVYNHIWKPEPADEPVQQETYSYAVAALHNPEESQKGIDILRNLSNQGDADASYLLSRLYFKSKLTDDYCPDSIKQLQTDISVGANNEMAHSLLVKAVEQDPHNYYALYDLACDYWKADQRTEAVSARDGQKAEVYYRQALEYARTAGDDKYVDMISGYLDRIEQWKENVRKINLQKNRE